MQALGLLLTVLLLGVGLVLNTAVLAYFLIRSIRALLPSRHAHAAPQQILLAHLKS